MAEENQGRPGRNDPCHCGSGKKYKHCCLAKDEEADRASRAEKASAAPQTEPAEEEEQAVPRTTSPRRAASQPWKRTSQTARPPRRITTPRKAG